jgi:hypothetical protein
MLLSERFGNVGSEGERGGYVVVSIKELDNEAPGVLEAMWADLLMVSSQILRRVDRSGSIFPWVAM